MKRREFIKALAGSIAMASPLAARAEQMHRVGMLVNGPETDALMMARVAAFTKTLHELGWTSENLRIDIRYGADNDELRERAKELVEFAPDVVLAMAPPSVFALRKVSRSVPIVFAAVTDPVGLGIVQSLARPGGNATGFTPAEFSTSAKWLELLKELAPNLRRVGILRDLSNPSAVAQFAAIQTAAAALGLEVSALAVRTASDIEHDLAELAKSPNSGVIVTRLTESISQRETIIASVERHQLPAVYPLRLFAAAG